MPGKKKDSRVVDFDAVNFRNKDVTKWTKPTGAKLQDYSKNKKPYTLRQLGDVTKVTRIQK